MDRTEITWMPVIITLRTHSVNVSFFRLYTHIRTHTHIYLVVKKILLLFEDIRGGNNYCLTLHSLTLYCTEYTFLR